jgi:hypothetical protein
MCVIKRDSIYISKKVNKSNMLATYSTTIYNETVALHYCCACFRIAGMYKLCSVCGSELCCTCTMATIKSKQLQA